MSLLWQLRAVDHVFTRLLSSAERFVVLDHAHRSLVQVQHLDEGAGSVFPHEHCFNLTLLENHQGRTVEKLLKAQSQWVAHLYSKLSPALWQDFTFEPFSPSGRTCTGGWRLSPAAQTQTGRMTMWFTMTGVRTTAMLQQLLLLIPSFSCFHSLVQTALRSSVWNSTSPSRLTSSPWSPPRSSMWFVKPMRVRTHKWRWFYIWGSRTLFIFVM